MKSLKNSPSQTAACSTRRTHRNLFIAAILSLLIAPFAQLKSEAQVLAPAPVYVQLNAVQLDQLVAPIALDPDPLVAQILTGSTFPDQVNDADNWLDQNMNLGPDQRAAQANNMSWDASIKGLIAFPAVLDSMEKNIDWTKQLGNAYFNQPGDVMNAIQAMRLQAQQAHFLVTTVQENVVVESGVIEILPVNPAVVFVPYYNPWHIWGALFVSYPGYVVLPPPVGVVLTSAVAFEPAINVGVYSQFGWGFSAWSASWGTGTVQCGNSTYISHSRSVINHGNFGAHDSAAFEHGGRGVPNGFRASAHAGSAHSASVSRNTSVRKNATINKSKSVASSHSIASSHTSSSSRNAGAHTTGRSPSTARNTAHNTVHNPAAGHTGSSLSRTGGRGPSTSHSPNSARSGSYGRTSMGRTASTNRSPGASHSLGGGRSMSANRNSFGASRSTGANRSLGASRSTNQARSFGGNRAMGSGAGRSLGAGRSMGTGRSMGASRPMSRPASMGGFGGNRSSFGGGNRSMSRPASIGRSGGFGGGGARMAGGRRR
ncbi:MAG: DUF3300 domain-containing protein [Terracidiphilus sp.]